MINPERDRQPTLKIRLALIRRIAAAAGLLVAMLILLPLFGILHPGTEIIFWYVLLTLTALLTLIAIVLWTRRFAQLRSARRTRDSVLKHLWEEQHRREW
jgi:Na+/melibiose symporter-like transporter